MRGKSRTAEQKIAVIASRQHGVVTRAQLIAVGVSPSSIDRRIERGLLIRQHRGVYRVGHTAPSTVATYMAAVLAAGEGAVLAGRAAGHLMKLLKGSAPPAAVIAPTERRVEGRSVRRERNIAPGDTMVWNGIPTTTIARTLVDLAAELNEHALGRACHEATVLYRTQPEDVEAVLARRPNAKGATVLRRILRGDTRVTLSKLERRFLEVLEENGLELPDTNTRVGGRYVDCRWPQRRLTVELDGYRYHSSRHAWEQDRKRERQARARGDDFRRYTYADVYEEPAAMMAELRSILRGSAHFSRQER